MSSKNSQDQIDQFLAKVKKMEKGEKLDLSSDEDLSIAIMNLISMEEHFFFTYGKTKDKKYLNLLYEIREMRKVLLKKIIKDYEGEVWCISKHLLASSMRLMEVGTKSLTKGNQKEASEFFAKAYDLYSLFWGLNLNVVKTKDIKTNKTNDIQYLADSTPPKSQGKASFFDKLGTLVQKAVDCCRE